MATWVGVARTNYFRVKDRTAFEEDMEGFPGVDMVWNNDYVALFGEEGYWPSYRMLDRETEDFVEEDIDDFGFEVSKHLLDGDVVVLQSAGFEKQRYVTGYASAFNSKGECLTVSIDDIYDKIKSAWGATPTACSL